MPCPLMVDQSRFPADDSEQQPCYEANVRGMEPAEYVDEGKLLVDLAGAAPPTFPPAPTTMLATNPRGRFSRTGNERGGRVFYRAARGL